MFWQYNAYRAQVRDGEAYGCYCLGRTPILIQAWPKLRLQSLAFDPDAIMQNHMCSNLAEKYKVAS